MAISVILLMSTNFIEVPNTLERAIQILYTVVWVLYIVYIIKDVRRARKEAEDYLRNQPMELKRLFEGVPIHIPDSQVDGFIKLRREKERKEKSVVVRFRKYANLK